MLLAKRDIRLGNLPFDDDLDHVPVKEAKNQAPFKTTAHSVHERVPKMANKSFSPGRTLASQKGPQKSILPRKPPINSKQHSSFLTVNIPTADADSPGNRSFRSISIMIDNLVHAYTDLGKPVAKQGYPDPIVEVRLQRRVEEQRRHLYRLLYNTKRHVAQLVDQLKRTAFLHRNVVLVQSNVFSHLVTAYRSLMSSLNSFIRVSRTLHSSFMTDLVKKIRSDLKELLGELKRICDLLDVPITSLDAISSPTQVAPNPSVERLPVPKLNLSEDLKQLGNAPLSPERNESLKAALKSLLINNIDATIAVKKDQPVNSRNTRSKTKNLVMKKTAPSSKPTNAKVIKPKTQANVSRYNTNYKRAMSADIRRGKRPLGQTRSTLKRPTSAPSQQLTADKLEIKGKVTPLITEREMARQAWIDELEKQSCPPTPHSISLESTSHPGVTTVVPGSIEPINIPKAESVSENKEMSTTMTQLLDELKEIQKEDEDIRSRWIHLQYSKPKIVPEEGSTVFLPSADLVWSNNDMGVLTHCQKRGPVAVRVPEHNMLQISSYREAMLQYLRLTKHFKTSGFDPWATINQIADSIAQDIVEDVCSDILASCDGIADNIFLSEFLPA